MNTDPSATLKQSLGELLGLARGEAVKIIPEDSWVAYL